MIGYEIAANAGKGSHIKLGKEGFPSVIIPKKTSLAYAGVWKRFLIALEMEITELKKLL